MFRAYELGIKKHHFIKKKIEFYSFGEKLKFETKTRI
jgi:hypothetical protein